MNNTYIKNLLSINKKAFQFLHDVEGFDFEKPYFITQQPGKFTANTVKKAVAEAMNHIKSLVLTATDGSGARFTYEPYNTYYGNEKRSADIADHIDKSGYLLRPHRFALMERAETLRRTRKQAEADSADYTSEIAELQKSIDATRILLSNAVLNCQDATAARGVANKMNYFSYALSYFETFKEKINNKRYASIERINSDIEDIKDKLNHCAE